MAQPKSDKAKNILGTRLELCCSSPVTGFFRDGFCHTGPTDAGAHLVCTQVTAEFLEFSQRAGNDLSTPRPEYGFPGLKPGDRWCVCAARWKEAVDAGIVAPVVLRSTHQSALQYATLEELKRYAVDFETN